jgi:antitoxin ParD1/3/4
MRIALTPAQTAWLEAHVANGDFGSVEEAARRLIDERIAELNAASTGRQRREALPVGALNDDELEAIARTEMAERHRHLDDELK